MAIAPKGDPRRPIDLAVIAARVLGLLTLGTGVQSGAGVLMAWPHLLPASVTLLFLIMGASIALFVFVSFGYLYFASQLKRLKNRAAVVLLVMVSLHGAHSAIRLAGNLIAT